MKNKNDLFMLCIFLLLNFIAVVLWNEWSFTLIGLSIILIGIYLKVFVLRRIENNDNFERLKDDFK